MSKGVTFLMKKNKIDVIMGEGTVKTGKTIDAMNDDTKPSPANLRTSVGDIIDVKISTAIAMAPKKAWRCT